MYSIDTNIYIDWWDSRYPPDIFPSVEKAMDALATSGKIIAPSIVHDEINHVGSKDLKQWAKNNKNIFVPHDTILQTEANNIQAMYPDLIDVTASYDEADRWLIALAKIKGIPVVTHETPARKKKNPRRKMFIPDVCSAMSIPCITFVELLRTEKLAF